MKIINTITLLIAFSLISNAQSVKGKLTLNGKYNSELKLESNSAVQLFKEFKTGKYKLGFSFDADGVEPNIYKETIVFFEFITKIKKDGKLVKNVIRKQPIPYFPGDMDLPAEAFDFIGLMADNSTNKEQMNMAGTIPEGNYTIELSVKPVDYKGKIKPVEFSFALGKRLGRMK